jgi:hypothetical protein
MTLSSDILTKINNAKGSIEVLATADDGYSCLIDSFEENSEFDSKEDFVDRVADALKKDVDGYTYTLK